MGTTWERLAGNTSKFAIKVSLSEDPDSGFGVSEEESASWGSLQMWISDKNICSYRFQGELVESVHWYLLPIIEWIVENWDPMLHEERLPNSNTSADAESSLFETWESPKLLFQDEDPDWDMRWAMWWSRHNLEASRSGGLLPSLCIRRWRGLVELSWDNTRVCSKPSEIFFTEPTGFTRLPIEEVANPLFAVLSDFAGHILESLPNSERLSTLRTRIHELREFQETRVGWSLALGDDIDDMMEAYRGILADIPSDSQGAVFGGGHLDGLFIPSFPAALMFGAVSPQLVHVDRIKLLSVLAEAHSQEGLRSRLEDECIHVSIDQHAPWDQGRDLAGNLLEDLGLDQELAEPIDLDSVINDLGITVSDIELEDSEIRAVAIGGRDYRPQILLNTKHKTYSYPTGKRFSIAHELCHLLFDRAYASEVVMPSGPWAPRDLEKRANAFGAMFLMPPRRIAAVLHELGNPQLSAEVVNEIASKLETSFTSAVEHIHNLSLISEEERDSLRCEAVDKTSWRT